MLKKLLTAGFALCVFHAGLAQNSGSLDESFGTNGRVITNVGLQHYVISEQAIQSDGKIIMVGQYRDTYYSGSFVLRTNTDGTLDTSFNGTGKIRITLDGFNTVKIQPDGKILVGGANESVMRFTANGVYDTAFNTTGYIYNPDSTNEVVDLVVLADGKILALANFIDYNNNIQDIKISRYNPDGTPDLTFDTDGSMTANLGLKEAPKAMAVQTDGKIVVNGIQSEGINYKYFVARFNSNGSFDTGFNGNGFQAFTFTGTTYMESFGMSLLPNGKIVTAGNTTVNTQGNFTYLTRLNANGTPDATFGTAGTYKTALAAGSTYSYDAYNRVKVRDDGKIIIAGNRYNNGQQDIILRRFNSNGTPDAAFGAAGILAYSFLGNTDGISDFNLIGNKILMTGFTEQSFFERSLVIALFDENGVLDNSFSDDGKTFLFMTDGGSDITHTAIKQNDGKILVGGSTYLNNTNRYAITRYNTDGSLDLGFASGTGKFVASLSGNVSGLAVDADQKIIVVGGDSTSSAGIFRLNTDGSLDTTFANGGAVNLSGQEYFAAQLNAVLVQPNGKIIIGGHLIDWLTGGSSTYANFALIRLNANGSYDTTFGNNGVSVVNIPGTHEEIKAVRFLDNGKIVAAGEINNGQNTDVAVLRFNSNGTLDSTFNGNGIATYDSGMPDTCTDLALHSDGRIVTSVYIGNNAFTMLRLLPDGSTDTSFGENGIVNEIIQDGSAANSIKILDDQKIIAVGQSYTEENPNDNIAVARFNSNGSLDTTFGDNGSAHMAVTNRNLYATACIVSGDKLIVAGNIHSSNMSTSDLILAKYHLNTVLGVQTPENNAVLFYPNPVITKAIFSHEVISATLFDLQGKQMPVLLVNNQMNVSGLSPGTYILKMTTQNNTAIVQKLVKK